MHWNSQSGKLILYDDRLNSCTTENPHWRKQSPYYDNYEMMSILEESYNVLL